MASGEYPLERRVEPLERDLREEAEAPQVDTEKRSAARPDVAGHGQQGAVPADHDDEIAARGERSAIDAGARRAGQPCRLLVHLVLDPTSPEPPDEPAQNRRAARVRLHDDAESLWRHDLILP